jgi:hypothetical protein
MSERVRTSREDWVEAIATPCDSAGHDWLDAGGGMQICPNCLSERWAPAEGECDE